MVLEDRALKMALAGDENLSSGMTGVASLDSNFTILKWALRYGLSLLLAFLSSLWIPTGTPWCEDSYQDTKEQMTFTRPFLSLPLLPTPSSGWPSF